MNREGQKLVSARKAPKKMRGRNASAPKAQLLILIMFLSSIAYRKWNFRVTGISRAFVKSKALVADVYVAPPLFHGKGQSARWKLSKPLHGLATACRERYLTVWGLLVRDLLGGKWLR